jgi:hypothetical protein
MEYITHEQCDERCKRQYDMMKEDRINNNKEHDEIRKDHADLRLEFVTMHSKIDTLISIGKVLAIAIITGLTTIATTLIIDLFSK